MRAPRSRGAAPEEDRRGRAAGHAPRRDARVLGPDRARPCAGSEAEAAPLPGGPPRSQPWSRARGGTPRPGGRARAAPGCTGAGARPRPPLRRIRGRALAWRTAEEPAMEPRPRRTADLGLDLGEEENGVVWQCRRPRRCGRVESGEGEEAGQCRCRGERRRQLRVALTRHRRTVRGGVGVVGRDQLGGRAGALTKDETGQEAPSIRRSGVSTARARPRPRRRGLLRRPLPQRAGVGVPAAEAGAAGPLRPAFALAGSEAAGVV
jgi:hypothetical protein